MNQSAKRSPAIVSAILDSGEKVVINKGERDGVKLGQRFLVYSDGQEIFDPISKESLGVLEIVKGTGRVSHLQEKMATIESDLKGQSERVIRKKGNSAISNAFGFGEEEIITPSTEKLPFENPLVGDKVKPL